MNFVTATLSFGAFLRGPLPAAFPRDLRLRLIGGVELFRRLLERGAKLIDLRNGEHVGHNQVPERIE